MYPDNNKTAPSNKRIINKRTDECSLTKLFPTTKLTYIHLIKFIIESNKLKQNNNIAINL